MKLVTFFSLISIFLFTDVLCTNNRFFDTRQVIIHFANIPINTEQHEKWNRKVDRTLNKVNEILIKEGYIAEDLDKMNQQLAMTTSYWEKIKLSLKKIYYGIFYKSKIIKYPCKSNFAFFTRKDYKLGYFAVCLPDGVPYKVFIEKFKRIFNKKDMHFYITPDYPVWILKNKIALEGKSLTLEELEALKNGTLIPELEKELVLLNKKTKRSIKGEARISWIKKRLKDLITMKEYLFWYQEIPTTGLRPSDNFGPVCYPFLPHFFNLWELAPNKGNNVKVANIDTGVAAFGVPEDPVSYKANYDLNMKADFRKNNYNLVSMEGLDPLEQFIYFIQPYIDKKKFNYYELDRLAPNWIINYLDKKDTDLIISYLKINLKGQLLSDKGELNNEGKAVLEEIVNGKKGIVKNFTIQKNISPINGKVIFQFLPLAKISKERTTFITGHGSHTFGLIGGKLKDSNALIPNKDIGICGIAPNADLVMIKAFNDDGTTEKSTLIAAIKEALSQGVDIVNLSLKIADQMNLSEKSSQLLRRVVGLIPYAVAASGNNGDPHESDYPGLIEAYPARFLSVFFDVGAFCYDIKSNTCSIGNFSQYEPNIGPLFVAPGCNILSSALTPGQKDDSKYVFMEGTSMAASIMVGFVALMLSEFKDQFTKDQLLNVAAKSAIKMHNNEDWANKVLLGVLDMRTNLLILHILKHIKHDLNTKSFDDKFENYLEAVCYILFELAQEYSKKYLDGVDFKTSFIDYFKKAEEKKSNFKEKEFFIPSGRSKLKETISFVVDILNGKSDKRISKDIQKNVKSILSQEKIDLFADLPVSVKKRLLEKDREEDYWHTKIEEIKLAKN